MAISFVDVNWSCSVVRQETGFYVHHRYLKYDGEPFYPGSTFAAVEEVLRHG